MACVTRQVAGTPELADGLEGGDEAGRGNDGSKLEWGGVNGTG